MALSPEPNREYLVEHYLPDAGTELLLEAAQRLQAETLPPAWTVTSIVVPGDRSLISVIAAPSHAHVRALCEAAGVHPDRISEAIRATTQPTARRRQ